MKLLLHLRAAAKHVRRRWRDARIRPTLPYAPIQRLDIQPRCATPTDPLDEGASSFSSERAWRLLLEQCAIGPRHPESDGHERMKEWLVEQLSQVTDNVAIQQWQQRVLRGAGSGRTYALRNVFGIIPGTASVDADPAGGRTPVIMLSTHWDTRLVADAEPDPLLRGRPVPGANDGASGVAVLLELARALSERPPAHTVIFAFWDGEDLGEFCYGSRLFARWLAHESMAPWRAQCGVVVDMVGARELQCVLEANSVAMAPAIWRSLHASVDQLGLQRHFRGRHMRIRDDHVPLNRAGIPTALLIDYSYPHWHTTRDTPEQCSAESLGVIGAVLEHWVRARGAQSAGDAVEA